MISSDNKKTLKPKGKSKGILKVRNRKCCIIDYVFTFSCGGLIFWRFLPVLGQLYSFCSVASIKIPFAVTYPFRWCGPPITPPSRASSEPWESSPVSPNRAASRRRWVLLACFSSTRAGTWSSRFTPACLWIPVPVGRAGATGAARTAIDEEEKQSEGHNCRLRTQQEGTFQIEGQLWWDTLRITERDWN